jgi:phenylpyruvate tautomerase PptA (4-oxalocrotonate tautomerase family)
MPHLSVHVLESDLAGAETALIENLTEAVVAVYGEWARSAVVVQLFGLPPHRWGIGGAPAQTSAPRVTFGIREAVFTRPDASEIVARLAAEVTNAIAAALGEQVRPHTAVELAATPPHRTAIGGTIVSD